MVVLQHSSSQVHFHPSPKISGTETGSSNLCGSTQIPRSSTMRPKGRTVSWSILPPLLGAEEKRCLASSHRFDLSKQIYKTQKVQDGNSVDNPASHTARRLDDLDRFEGRLFPRSSGNQATEISQVPRGTRTPSIRVPTLWADNLTASLHQNPVGSGGLYQTEKDKALSLSRRPPCPSSGQDSALSTKRSSNLDPVRIRLAPEPNEKPFGTNSTPSISGGPVRHSEENHLSSDGKDPCGSGEDFSGARHPPSEGVSMSKDHRNNGFHNPHGEMGIVETTSLPVRLPQAVEVRQQESADSHLNFHEEQPLLVASAKKPTELPFYRPGLLGHSDDRCQWLRLGGPVWYKHGTRQMG
ncbi:uncharacterized protein LOC120928357 [Rana temporaria]|uniref:uncharacterized protein LOC120928357 n=1 Tax=Rana temporaria TaxID=8407 RepID=UPI001AAD7CAC|nr:uncharacterized protein LOC120928357 [Rana temporaria]